MPTVRMSGADAMFDFTLHDRLFLGFSAALGLIVAGAGNALVCPRSRLARTGIAATGLAAALAGVAGLAPAYILPAALIGAGFLAIPTLTPLGVVRRIAAAVRNRLREPRLAWGLVALIGLGLLLNEFARFDAVENNFEAEQYAAMARQIERLPYVADESHLAKTDRGSAIHLLTTAQAPSAEYLANNEQTSHQMASLNEYLIRRGPADESSNCHGWVFTGGKFGILGQEVDTILEENDYFAVTGPAMGDLCVYRGEDNAVAHTAIVRGVFDDGTILVEGKWGRLGIFLHPVEHSVYGEHYGYYRSARTTHLLSSVP